LSQNIQRDARYEIIACVVAPILVVLVGRSVGPFIEPAPVTAGLVATMSEEQAELTPVMKTTNQVAREHLDRLIVGYGVSEPHSPFRVTEPDAAPVEVVVFEEEVIRHNNEEIHAPSLMVSSIVSGSRPVAVIDGSIRRVGDRVSEEWRLSAIDAHGREITIKHETGLVVRIELESR
jgi:hypothetical protein